MRRFEFTKPIYIFLFGIMVVSLALMFFLAGIAVNHEKETASLVRNIQVNLREEMASVILDVAVEFLQVERDLCVSAVFPLDSYGGDHLLQWKQRSSLVGIPFRVSAGKELFLPPRDSIISVEGYDFFVKNSQFLIDKAVIPVFKSIALEYSDEIDSELLRIRELEKSVIEKEAMRSANPLGDAANPFNPIDYLRVFDGQFSQAGMGLNNDLIVDTKDPYITAYAELLPKASEVLLRRLPALDIFDDFGVIRKKIYRQAAADGRNIFLKGKPGKKPVSPFFLDSKLYGLSEFISKPSTFSRIIDRNNSGIIPRIIGGNLNLIFWKKELNGDITGCLIDRSAFKERIGAISSGHISPYDNDFDKQRSIDYSICILDEHGIPLGAHSRRKFRDWKHPVYSREISEKIPYWEVAGYPPGNYVSVLSKARMTALILWMLAAGFLMFNVVGITLIFKSLFGEIKIARQKTTFVANVSHELKTPLTSIRMLTELIKTRRQIDEKKKEEYLDMVISETERLTRLINDVLDFSGLERGKKTFNFRAINIVALCKAVFEIQKVRLAHNGFEVRFMSEYDELNVKADEESLVRVIINLLSNAEKYSAEKKEIALELSKHHGFALITIFDRGIGIPLEKAKDLFKEFSRVDNRLTAKVKGAGLGLVIAKHIVLAHKGDIQYFPRDGGGSIFQIKIPLVNL
ncbi:MAG: HAMP domain-containing sensor histidine kinase [Candidatus Omnitrophota bacterium]